MTIVGSFHEKRRLKTGRDTVPFGFFGGTERVENLWREKKLAVSFQRFNEISANAGILKMKDWVK